MLFRDILYKNVTKNNRWLQYLLLLGYSLVIILLTSYFVYVLILSKMQQNQEKMQTSHTAETAPLPGDTRLEQNVTTETPQSTLDQEIGTDSTGSASVILHGSRDSKQIALTFDAEMTEFMRDQVETKKVKDSYDKRIIDLLDKTGTKATFFLTGIWIELYPIITKQLSNDPLFELGSHSYGDYSYSGSCFGLLPLTDEQKIEQVGATELLLKIYGGIENKLFRFPGGCYSQSNLNLIHQVNDVVVHWDVNANDGFNNNTQQIINNVISTVQNGSIIIMHLNGSPNAPKTFDALQVILPTLKAQGYQFVKVSELLNLSPEQRVY